MIMSNLLLFHHLPLLLLATARRALAVIIMLLANNLLLFIIVYHLSAQSQKKEGEKKKIPWKVSLLSGSCLLCLNGHKCSGLLCLSSFSFYIFHYADGGGTTSCFFVA